MNMDMDKDKDMGMDMDIINYAEMPGLSILHCNTRTSKLKSSLKNTS
jgi:hypothetical protein